MVDGVCVFIRLANELKRLYPTLTIRVRRVPLAKNLFGDCYFEDGEYRIRVNKKKDWRAQLETLAHEFAHAAAYSEWLSTGHHGPIWGKEYAKTYQVYEKTISN